MVTASPKQATRRKVILSGLKRILFTSKHDEVWGDSVDLNVFVLHHLIDFHGVDINQEQTWTQPRCTRRVLMLVVDRRWLLLRFQVGRWITQASQTDRPAFTGRGVQALTEQEKRIKDLERENAILRQEREILKAVAKFFLTPQQHLRAWVASWKKRNEIRFHSGKS
jgi:transposase-like protein